MDKYYHAMVSDNIIFFSQTLHGIGLTKRVYHFFLLKDWKKYSLCNGFERRKRQKSIAGYISIFT